MPMTQDKNDPPKTKMKLFDYILESSIKSSKTIIEIVTELVNLANDVNNLRASLVALSKVIQIQQNALDDIYKIIEQSVAKKSEVGLPPLTSNKKDKPN